MSHRLFRIKNKLTLVNKMVSLQYIYKLYKEEGNQIVKQDFYVKHKLHTFQSTQNQK